LIPIMVGSQLAHMFVLAGLYAYRKRRPRTLILLPAFVAVAYLESLLFTLGFLKAFRLGKDGRWESPARVAATVTKRG